MGFLGRFSAPKANIELKLNQTDYAHTDKLSGLVTLESLEDFPLEELRLDLRGYRDFEYRTRSRRVTSKGWPLGTTRTRLTGQRDIWKGERLEQPFKVDIPFHPRKDPFMKTWLKANAVAVVKGRQVIKCGLRVGVQYPYIIKCARVLGGCGFVYPPSWEPALYCSRCGRSLEAQWNRRYTSAMGGY